MQEAVFTYRKRVEFSDTDMAGIVHFSNYFRYMEMAEHAFWRHLGTSVMLSDEEGKISSWPRVQVSCNYSKPLRFEQEVDIQVRVLEKRPKVLVFGFTFLTAHDNQAVASGRMTVVHATMHGGRMVSVEMPADLYDAFIISPEPGGNSDG